ncbi:MAG: DUF5674 family protein [Candidatus Omnitrophota bacterium]
MEIIKNTLKISQLKEMAERLFGNLVKAVVDTEQEWLAVDGELHSDLEAFLLEGGSKQKNLWGINLYVDRQGEDFIEFDSVINMRPSQNNRSRGVDSPEIRKRITDIVNKRLKL